jgi:hypothetical protein
LDSNGSLTFLLFKKEKRISQSITSAVVSAAGWPPYTCLDSRYTEKEVPNKTKETENPSFESVNSGYFND